MNATASHAKHMKIVEYVRVSTTRQGLSGLGLEAQREAVSTYARQSGGEIVKSYTEVETGTGSQANRPELIKALSHAKRLGATLVIARLDRLARNVVVTSTLMEAGVEFVALDIPFATRFTIHIYAAVAEEEARKISERTKAALAARKARGGLMGSALNGSRLTLDDRRKGNARGIVANREKARMAVADLLPEILRLKADGLSLRAIASALNASGHVTANGSAWTMVQVRRVLRREGVATNAAI